MLSILSWLERLIPIMSTYCSFFKETATLGHCSPFGPSTGLISSKMTTLTSNNAAGNIIYQLQEAFPDLYQYVQTYDHRSYEISIPQPHQLMGQYSAIIC
ncbi:unnamed protein product [Macrosiphum euphorbiae]|uniref:Uncharacterized protein n=1 Tax=Macrosiphum euphorbiae TaxID=13131 RepID=A0AAV0WHW6_9HEMI|nr:unnamed protein product [Macrosiphum euphorbiae]